MEARRKWIRYAWESTRHALAFRSLLEIIGVWPIMVPFIVAICVGLWALLKGFALFMAGAISAGALVLMLWLPIFAIYLAHRSGRWQTEGERLANSKMNEWLKNGNKRKFKGPE
jgi:hypothetical protein